MKTRIIIAGGGFAGLYAAKYLDKSFAHRSDVEVILISRENFILFTPLLNEVAAGDLYPGDISTHSDAFFVMSRLSKPRWKQSTWALEEFVAELEWEKRTTSSRLIISFLLSVHNQISSGCRAFGIGQLR